MLAAAGSLSSHGLAKVEPTLSASTGEAARSLPRVGGGWERWRLPVPKNTKGVEDDEEGEGEAG